jgi:hypothetical protein
MPEPDLLELFVERLEEMGASYLVTGSVAATLYGEPRATHDIDLVVELSAAHQLALPRVFPAPDFYLPPPEVVRRECERPEVQPAGEHHAFARAIGRAVHEHDQVQWLDEVDRLRRRGERRCLCHGCHRRFRAGGKRHAEE